MLSLGSSSPLCGKVWRAVVGTAVEREYIGVQRGVEAVARQRRCVADDDEFHPRPRHGDVHAAQVGEEAYVAPVVGADEADEHGIAFLPLEAVHRVDRDAPPEGLEGWVAPDHRPQQAHLGLVGGDDGKVDVALLDPRAAEGGEIAFQGLDDDGCFRLVHLAFASGGHCLAAVAV